MTFIYSCPRCRHILGSDTDILPSSCPECGTSFNPEALRAFRRRDRRMHIFVLSGCAAVGGAALAGLLVVKLAPDSTNMGTFILAGLVVGLVGGFFGLKRYDAWRNGPM